MVISSVIERKHLARFDWLFAKKLPRLPYAGRLEGQSNETNGHLHGRFHSAVFTTNGVYIDLQISCKVLTVDKDKNLFVTIRKGNSPKSYHFTITPAREGSYVEEFKLFRKPKSIVLEFGNKQFKILKQDIAIGKVVGNGPVDILWSENDKFRYDFVVESYSE